MDFSSTVKIPDGLEPCFLAPYGWQTGHFQNPATQHDIHYGCAKPYGKSPRAIIVCLGGLSEFSEKYYEFAHDMLDRGYAFWTMDWAYQGRSSRMSSHPMRRHSDGFHKDVSDLDYFIENIITPHHTTNGEIKTPYVMVAHSMGGHLGLRYLHDHPSVFAAAAMSAPFLGIANFHAGIHIVAHTMKTVEGRVHKNYVFGGKDWNELLRKGDGTDIFSSDSVRDSVHPLWCKADPALQVGAPTFGWLFEALKSCKTLNHQAYLKKIVTPLFVAAAEKDVIVDNQAIKRAARFLPNVNFHTIKQSKHEILMERDDMRTQFLSGFDNLIKQNKIVPDLTP